jgi:asparagine synthase (glutamine-hydrolysing)
MRGILPEAIRTRIGKGGPTERFTWTLLAHRQLLEPLVQDPILAQLGVVDAATLRRAFDAAPHVPYHEIDLSANVLATLSVEAWLQMRSGRWPRESHHPSSSRTLVMSTS